MLCSILPRAVRSGRPFVLVLAAISALASVSGLAQQSRERLLITEGWRFHRGDAPDAGDSLGYAVIRSWVLPTGADLINAGMPAPQRPEGTEPGAGVSFVQPSFDDSAWRALDLPHDWGIEGPFMQERPGDTGKLPWHGVGWYRKTLPIPASDEGRRIYLDIDGAMAYSAVWLNGRLVGGWPYGYSSYRLDLTPYVNFGGANVLAVRLDNPDDSSRWYPGSGLYRNVWLVKTAPVHIAHWGTTVSTPIISADEAVVKVDVVVDNTSQEKVAVSLTTAIHELSREGAVGEKAVVRSEPIAFEMDPKRDTEAMRTHLLRVAEPRLWDLASPNRYVAVTTLERDGRVIDRVETPFGIRTIRYDATEGFFLNDRKVMLQGVCMHHDLGALGAAIHVRAIERQIEILQAMGTNAIRTSHNPPAPELLEACDRLGMLVMDEAFDAWRRGKKKIPGTTEKDGPMRFLDYARIFDEWHERDTRALVRRDRNHPSVIMWSIGNEVGELHHNDGWRLAARLAGIMREEDRTRPITIGSNSRTAPYFGFQTAVDLIGFNYKPDQYAPFHAAHPDIPVYGSETASTVSSRGEYFFPVSDDKSQGQADFHVSSYDLYAPRWATTPEDEWRGMDANPHVFGEFVWTGFDYLGEPTPYNADVTNLLNYSDPKQREAAAKELEALGRIRVPSRSSYFGIIDLAGFPKDRYYLYQARWRPDLRMAHILPHWTWPERVGEVTPVFVYSSGDEAELFVNGKSQGRKPRGPGEYRFRWDDVVYQPGEVKVVTWKQGKPWAEASVKTAGEATQLKLAPDRETIRADGRDLVFVTATVLDAAKQFAPRADDALTFTVSGPGEIVATDNGDPTSFESFQSPQRKAFNGLALVIVRAKKGASGPITVRVESQGLAPAETVIQVR